MTLVIFWPFLYCHHEVDFYAFFVCEMFQQLLD